MESWSYTLEGKGPLFSDEMDLPIDAFARSRKPLMAWDNKPSYNFENNGLISDRDMAESMEFMGLGFPDLMKKPFHGKMVMLSGEGGSDSSKIVVSPNCIITSNSSFGELESSSKFSSSLMESNSQDSSLIDLKLGRFADCKDAENSKLSKVLTKKARTTSSYSPTPFCQVHGCNKDLSSSKDYHKRHKVCDAHSKTAKVIVNGIEQRFCQQCSRFHLLTEFDDGKRSCRKRLAGHNERRRKPQLDTLSGKSHKLLQSYQGTRYLGTSLPNKTPFVFPDIFRAGILYPGKYEQGDRCKHIKLEGESICSPQSAVSITSGHLFPKPFLHLHAIGKQQCSGISSLGTEDYTVFDTAPTAQELSGASNSSCALSLLSAQSQDLSSHLTGIPMASPQIAQGGFAQHGVGQISDKPFRLSSMEQYGSNGFYSCGLNSMEADQVGSIMLSDASDDFQVHADEIFQESEILNAKYSPSPEHGPTVDLLQLSSHLQRVEQQRSSIQVKQESEDFCCMPSIRGACKQQG